MRRFIYLIRDPRDNSPRYVGATAHLANRIKFHTTLSPFSSRQPAKAAWMQFIHAIGLKPIVEVLEVAEGDEWEALERKWIAQFGCPFNKADGGEISRNFKRNEWTKKKIGDAHRGTTHTLTAKGHQKLKQEGERMSKNLWGSMTPEESAEFSQRRADAYWEGIPTEERSRMATERNKAAWANRSEEERKAIGQKVAAARKANAKEPSNLCKMGHEFTAENTYITKQGWRQCKACNAAKAHRDYLARKGKT